MSLTPLSTRNVLELRVNSKQREVEYLNRQIREKLSTIAKLAGEIRWHKLQLEDIGAPFRE